MLRQLLWLVFFIGLGWLIRRVFGRRPADQAPQPAAGPARKTGSLVRDRVCNTYLPKARALTESRGGEEHFFCSERCRGIFLAGG